MQAIDTETASMKKFQYMYFNKHKMWHPNYIPDNCSSVDKTMFKLLIKFWMTLLIIIVMKK